MVGDNVRKYPGLYREVLSQGHRVGKPYNAPSAGPEVRHGALSGGCASGGGLT